MRRIPSLTSRLPTAAVFSAALGPFALTERFCATTSGGTDESEGTGKKKSKGDKGSKKAKAAATPAPTTDAKVTPGVDVPPPPPPPSSTAAPDAAKNASASSTEPAPVAIRDMLPRQLMSELDRFIVGQSEAKRAVAVALRNRWRRHQVQPVEMRDEISPKNILMIGPTGVGKTEIARRLAKLTDAPFVKVEATKFTEVGFHGRDVDSIIDDLLKVALSQTKAVLMRKFDAEAHQRAEARVLKALAGSADDFREHLRNGSLNDVDVTIDIREKKEPPKQNIGGDTVQVDLPSVLGLNLNKPRVIKKTMKISEALPLAKQEELDKMVEAADITKEAIRACEEDGIVVIDEIDKIVTPSTGYKGHQASAEGVQQDLLPLVEGTTVSCKAANGAQIKTDKILFICSGAFHMVKPSDMLAELQGRLPIRVELKPLTEEDFLNIITKPQYNLIRQNTAMLATEGVELEVTDDAKKEIARIAAHVNGTIQNIGARRLITIVEKVMEEISFDGPELAQKARAAMTPEQITATPLVTKFVVDGEYVRKSVDGLVQKVDVTKYLL